MTNDAQITIWIEEDRKFVTKNGTPKLYKDSYREIAEQINKDPRRVAGIVHKRNLIAVFSRVKKEVRV